MIVERVYINTYRKDFFFCRVCISSIRYWYPEIPIYLVKDLGAGRFDTGEVEREFNVKVLDTGEKSFGWGFGKFEPLFLEGKHSFLYMDADTVMTGPVLDQVVSIDADFIVDREDLSYDEQVRLNYDPVKVTAIVPGFNYPGYMFNSGQWFGTSGILKRSDFEQWVEWTPRPTLRYADVFRQADQGVFNFVLHYNAAKGRIRVERINLMIWPDGHAEQIVDLDAIRMKRDPVPRVIHWAGMNRKDIRKLPRADIIHFFTRQYYARTGAFRRITHRFEAWRNWFIDFSERVRHKMSKISSFV